MSNPKKVIIMRGVSGSGKSTYIRKHYPDAKIASADEFFMRGGEYRFNPQELGEAHQYCWRIFWHHVSSGAELIVIDNTNMTAIEISAYVLPAEARGYEVEILTVTTQPKIAAQRNIQKFRCKRSSDSMTAW